MAFFNEKKSQQSFKFHLFFFVFSQIFQVTNNVPTEFKIK